MCVTHVPNAVTSQRPRGGTSITDQAPHVQPPKPQPGLDVAPGGLTGCLDLALSPVKVACMRRGDQSRGSAPGLEPPAAARLYCSDPRSHLRLGAEAFPNVACGVRCPRSARHPGRGLSVSCCRVGGFCPGSLLPQGLLSVGVSGAEGGVVPGSSKVMTAELPFFRTLVCQPGRDHF